MATIPLHNDCQSTTTTIPNIFLDQFMPEANGEFVKVYLYLLRCVSNHSSDCSVSAIADCFDHTEKDVIRALKYWERMGLLRLDFGEDKSISGITMLDINATATKKVTVLDVEEAPAPKATRARRSKTEDSSAAPSPEAITAAEPAVPEVPAVKATAKRKEYTKDEIKALCTDPDVTELFFIIETYLKHPLSSTDTNTILYWYDQLHFSSELIIYLVEYCISKSHTSTRYMDKVALGWHESGITTVEQAKENAAAHSKAYYAVMKALGISGRNLVDKEIAFVDRWSKEYAFDLDIIREACSRTIAATHQPSFEYTDTILTNWFKNQVHTKDDIAKLDAARAKGKKAAAAPATARRTGFSNFNQRDYDYDELEAMLLNTSVQ